MSNELDNDPFADDTDLDTTPAASQQDSNANEESLSADEKRRAIEAWNSGEKALLKIIQTAVGPEVTGRHKKGIAVKKYLASLGMQAVPAQQYQRNSFELTEEHKEYIRSHALQNKPLELARELFNQPTMSNLAIEARAVLAFYNTLDSSLRFVRDSERDEIQEYRPPNSHEQALARINRYVFEGMDKNNITQREKQCLDGLIKYTHVHQFLYTMNEMQSQRDRELFESSYIRFVYDKPDTTEEEINMYINLCLDIVQHARMTRELETLIETRDQILNDTGKLPVSVVEEINGVRKELGENQKRQKALVDSLQGKRADRLKNRIKENASVVQLVDMWKKETSRRQMIKLAEARKDKVKKEVENLDNMDDLRFQLWGMGKQEILDY